MSRSRGGFAGTLAPAATAAWTTWAATFSWRGFTEVSAHFLGPLLLLGAVVAGVGAAARWWRLPLAAVVGLQVLASGMLASALLCGSPFPVGAAWGRLSNSIVEAIASADRYAPPVPSDVPGVAPLLIVGGLACLLLVDLLACTLRRAPLAGLPLLTIYSIPVSLTGGGVSWWVFSLTAAGFLGLLSLQESDQVVRWGRPLGHSPDAADPSSFGGRTGDVRGSAGSIGSVATVLAVFLPLLIPTLDLHVFDLGRGPGGDSDIVISNPMADLRRDLNRGQDVALLRVTTDDPHPEYLRISVLNRFLDNEWTSGDRDVPTSNRADGDMPDLQGVATSVTRTEFDYRVSVTSDFRSSWLPTQAPISRIVADGDWRYDPATMDFIAGDRDLTAAGLEYSMTGVRLGLTSEALANAPSSVGLVSKEFTSLPTGLPSSVRNLADEVTREAPSRFEKAVALQRWFRETGGFTYDPRAAPGNGTDELVAFLTEGEDGRTGYCEQFAASMAVMARILGIPARVAVGFLTPRPVGPRTWEYSSHDLHAWPELFFPGAGWVRFEPTPAGRAHGVPGYTTQVVPAPNLSGGPGNPRPSEVLPSRGASSSAPTDAGTTTSGHDSGTGTRWALALGGLAGLVLGSLLLLLPRTLRRTLRDRRLAGDLETVWGELRATAVDLGVPWPESRSPRETGNRLVQHFGAPEDEYTPDRPAHGTDLNPDAVLALDRIVHALELRRYARGGSDEHESLRAEVVTCIEALEGGATLGARRRARWWPRSVVSRLHRTGPVSAQRPVQARYGGVVDHVG